MSSEIKEILLKVAALLAAVLAAMLLILFLLIPKPSAPLPTDPPETTEAIPPETQPRLPQSPYGNDAFVMEDGYMTCLAADTMLGIDVSHHQKEIDWARVKEAGIEFVMVRLGYRGMETGLLNEDRYVRQNLQGARDAGLLVGAYFYSQALTPAEAEEEARFALEILGDFQLDLPLTFDWEVADRTEHAQLPAITQSAHAFCRVVKEAGYEPMIYFNTYQALFLMDLHQLTEYRWWLAMYDTDRPFPCRFDMWQYTCTGSVPGIEGNVDINVMLKSQPD